MGANTKIEWCHHTVNTHWGYTKVSDGCKNCYAETWANRWGENLWGPKGSRRMIKSVLADVRKWSVAAAAADERRRVFWGSMMDVCEDRPELVEPRKRMCGLIEEFDEQLDFLLLTKRPEDYPRLMPWGVGTWPSNVWAGASAENQNRVAHATRYLQRFLPAIRWLSIEPLLEDVSTELSSSLGLITHLGISANGVSFGPNYHAIRKPSVNWIVVGGESGPGARPCNVEWIRSIVRQCQAAVVPVFVKQLGAKPVFNHIVPGCSVRESLEPLDLKDPKGGDMNEWPFPEIRLRQFPKAVQV